MSRGKTKVIITAFLKNKLPKLRWGETEYLNKKYKGIYKNAHNSIVLEIPTLK